MSDDEVNNPNIYHLHPGFEEMLRQRIAEVEAGHFVTDEEVNRETEQWLEEKFDSGDSAQNDGKD